MMPSDMDCNMSHRNLSQDLNKMHPKDTCNYQQRGENYEYGRKTYRLAIDRFY